MSPEYLCAEEPGGFFERKKIRANKKNQSRARALIGGRVVWLCW